MARARHVRARGRPRPRRFRRRPRLTDPEISIRRTSSAPIPPTVFAAHGRQRIDETAQVDPLPLSHVAYPPGLLAPLVPGRRETPAAEEELRRVHQPQHRRACWTTLDPAEVLLFGVATDVCDHAAILGLLRRGRRVTFVQDAARGLDERTDARLPRPVARRGGAVHDERRCRVAGLMETPPLVLPCTGTCRIAAVREIVPSGGRCAPPRPRCPPRNHPRSGDRHRGRRRCGLDRVRSPTRDAVLQCRARSGPRSASRGDLRRRSEREDPRRSVAGGASSRGTVRSPLRRRRQREGRRRRDSWPPCSGGTAVLDDFWFDPGLSDPRRDAWLHHPLLSTIELWVTRERCALVSVRR